MLRALARGRALEEGRPGATRAAYLAALRDLSRAYPDDPTTAEGRWLLGAAEAEDDRLAEAIAHWRSLATARAGWTRHRPNSRFGFTR